MNKPHYVSETQILREIVADPKCRYRWTAHALAQMRERGIYAEDIKHALTSGHVALEERKKDILWRVEGNDVDGNRIDVVVAVYADAIVIKVVTAF